MLNSNHFRIAEAVYADTYAREIGYGMSVEAAHRCARGAYTAYLAETELRLAR